MSEMVLLMYHELERAGRPLCDSTPGYVRYVVKETDFQAHLAQLSASGCRGINVSQALEGAAGVTLTFDDGPESDLVIAAPALRAAGFGATFYVVAGWIGRPGFLKPEQLRELAGDGLEIGSHGMSHAFMSDLSDQELRRELGESKARLEEMVQQPVVHFSCPGGRWDERVANIAAELGYQSVATSRLGVGHAEKDRYKLPRMAITQDTTLADFERLSRGELSGRDRARQQVLTVAKSLLGNGIYQKARGALLGGNRTGGQA